MAVRNRPETVALMTAADTVIVLAYLVVVMTIGFLAGRREGRTAIEFFLAGNNLPWYLIGTSFVASSINTEQMIGTVGFAYLYGMPIVNWELITLPIYTLLIVFFVPIYLRNRITTVPEFLIRRFGPACRTYYAAVTVVGYVVINLATVLYSGALVLTSLFHVEWLTFPVAIVLLVLFTGSYTIYGGLSAVVWTDMVQCFILLLGGIFVFYLGLEQIPGGWDGMISILEADDPAKAHIIASADHPVVPWPSLIVGTLTIWIWYQVANQFMVQRVLGAKSEWDARMGIVSAGIINFVRPLATCFAGIVVFALVLSHDTFIPLKATLDAKPDLAFMVIMEHLVPPVLRGVIVAGLLGAIMSTIDSLINSTSTVFTLDLFRPYVNPEASDELLVRVGRLAGIGALVLAGLWAPMVGAFGTIFEYFQIILLAVATPTMVVLWTGIFWPRATKQAALTILLIGIPIYLIPVFVLRAQAIEFSFLYVGGIVSIILTVLMVLISLSTKPPDRVATAPYIWNRDMLVTAGAETVVFHKRVGLWYGVFAVVWVMLYAFLW